MKTLALIATCLLATGAQAGPLHLQALVPTSGEGAAAEEAAPDGYASIFDSSGVATLTQSYNHLAPTGRLIVFGFHTNLPIAKDCLSPFEWIKMALRMQIFFPSDTRMSARKP